jgi:hypothetical protein
MVDQEQLEEYCSNLRLLADWMEQHVNDDNSPIDWLPGIDLHFSLTENDYVNTGTEEEPKNEYVLNEANTKKSVKSFVKMLGSCEKEYIGSTLYITKEFGSYKIKVTGSVTREITCKKVLTGEVIEHPETIVPARTEEKFVWDCSDVPSLLALVTE